MWSWNFRLLTIWSHPYSYNHRILDLDPNLGWNYFYAWFEASGIMTIENLLWNDTGYFYYGIFFSLSIAAWRQFSHHSSSTSFWKMAQIQIERAAVGHVLSSLGPPQSVSMVQSGTSVPSNTTTLWTRCTRPSLKVSY